MEKLGGGKKEKERWKERRKGKEERKREEIEKERWKEIKNGIKKLNMRIRILISYNFYVSIYNGKRLLSI